MASSASARKEETAVPPAGNLGKASNGRGDTANLLAGARSSIEPQFVLTRQGQSLPDLPGTFQMVRTQKPFRAFGRGSLSSGIPDESPAAPAAEKTVLNSSKENRATSRVLFWSLQGMMFASAVAAAESTSRCLDAGSCTKIPTPLKSRAALYNIGIPASVGISVLSYEMKKHGNRWWFLPPAITTAASGVLTVHGVQVSH